MGGCSQQYELMEERLKDIGARVGAYSACLHLSRLCPSWQAPCVPPVRRMPPLSCHPQPLPLCLLWQVTPVNDAVKALKQLCDFIRHDTVRCDLLAVLLWVINRVCAVLSPQYSLEV